jgi:hypothetical protein
MAIMVDAYLQYWQQLLNDWKQQNPTSGKAG